MTIDLTDDEAAIIVEALELFYNCVEQGAKDYDGPQRARAMAPFSTAFLLRDRIRRETGMAEADHAAMKEETRRAIASIIDRGREARLAHERRLRKPRK